MSVDEIQRIMNHLDRQDQKISDIQQSVTRILVTVEDVPQIVDKLNSQETVIQLVKKDQKNCQAHCAAVQEEKKKSTISWGTVKTSVVVGIIMTIITAAFTAWVTLK